MRDKALTEMAELLFPLADHVVLTQAQTGRAASPKEIREASAQVSAGALLESTVAEAIDRARSLTPKNGVVVITGSIYIVGEALNILQSRA